MIYIYFVFVGEGPTDDALLPHLEKLCILCGADEANGIAIDWLRSLEHPSRKVAERIRLALALEPGANLIFVHRDADSPDPEPRHQEIHDALEEVQLEIPGVAVVPVQETEAWLLLDETEIRRAAENPKGQVSLNLPSWANVERIGQPKELLFETLLKASELSGRRRDRFARSLSHRRRLLLERLDPEGKIRRVKAWKRLKADLTKALRTLGRAESRNLADP